MAEVDNSSFAPVVARWAWAPFETESLEGRARTIHQLFVEYNFSQKTVVAALAQKAALLKIVTLPAASPADTASMADIQAWKLLPLLAEEPESGYEILEEKRTERLVALTIARRGETEDILSTLSAAGVRPESVVPEFYALLFASCGRAPAGDLALIHTDAERMIFVCSRREKVSFARAVDFNGDGDSRYDDERILAEWRKCAGAFEGPYGPVRIVLAGDAAALPYLKERFHKETGLQVESSDPFSIVSRLAGAPENLEGQTCALVALGAAMSAGTTRLNFLPRAEKQRRAKILRLREWAGVAAAAVFLFASLGVVAFQKSREMKRRLQIMEMRLTVLRPEAVEAEKMLKEIALARARRDTRGAALGVLSEVSKTMSADVALSALDYEKGERVSIRAAARNLSAAASWVRRIAQSGTFRSVELRSSSVREGAAGAVVDFQAVGILTPGEMNELTQG